MNKLQHIAIFASGKGSNAEKIIEHFTGKEFAKVALIVTNRKDAGVTSVAEKAGIDVLIIEKDKFFRGDAYVDELQSSQIGFIVLAGFLWKIPQPLIDAFRNRIINLHPALLPKYGGKGMYREHVHRAVLDNNETETGITIHYVDEHYDNGDVIKQAVCPVLPGDTPETLAARVHSLEHAIFPQVVEDCVRKL